MYHDNQTVNRLMSIIINDVCGTQCGTPYEGRLYHAKCQIQDEKENDLTKATQYVNNTNQWLTEHKVFLDLCGNINGETIKNIVIKEINQYYLAIVQEELLKK